MLNYYLGPFQTGTLAGRPTFQPPSGAVGVIDLRSIPDHANPGVALFSTPDTLGSDYRLFGSGHIADIVPPESDRSVFASMLGLPTASGDTLLDWLWTALALHSDATGNDRVKPLIPTGTRGLELHLGGHGHQAVRLKRFSLGMPEAAKVIETLQHEYVAARTAALDGKLGQAKAGAFVADQQFHRRVLDYWGEKFNVNNPEDIFIPKGLPKEKRLEHSTTITESFNTADSTTLGPDLTWTELDGQLEIVSNQCRSFTLDAAVFAQAESDLSSVDHYCQAIVNASEETHSAQSFVYTRRPGAGNYYYAGLLWDVDQILLGKVVSSSATTLDTDAQTATAGSPLLLKQSSSGSTISSYVGGVLKQSVTDTSLTTGLRTGIFGYKAFGGYVSWDSFEAADISTSTDVIPVNDANWYRTPLGSRLNGSTSIITNTTGNEEVLAVGPTTIGTLNLSLGSLSTGKLRVAYSVDGGAEVTADLTSATASIAMLTGGASTTHTFRWKLISIEGSALDRWTTPVLALVETGFVVSSGATTSAYTPHTDKLMLVYGDEIMEAARLIDTTDTLSSMNATLHAPNGIAAALNAAYCGRAIGGGGWYHASAGNTPPLFRVGDDTNSYWNKYYSGQTMFSAGLYTTQPDYIFVCTGYNDSAESDANVTASVTGFLTAARAAAPSAWLIIVYPYSRVKASAILTGYSNYTSYVTLALSDMTVLRGTTDSMTALIDLGTDFALRLNQFPTPSDKSPDGLHAGQRANLWAAGRISRAIQLAIGGSSSITGNQFNAGFS